MAALQRRDLWPLGVAFAAACLSSPAIAAGKKKAEQVEITFTGYESRGEGRGLLFVEMSAAVTVEVTQKGKVVEYKLVGAKVPLRNNKNPLLMQELGSSAVSARLVAGKKSVSLVVTMRSPSTPPHRIVARGKGAALEIELPAASAAPEPAPAK